jgi:glycosyltransferase involved in cell wall biosynthesis
MSAAAGAAPEVSVVVAAHDAEATLCRALDALRAQTFNGGYEVIVVDDHSGDGTYELAAGFGEPVRAVRNDGARGPGNTRNAGVAAARGEVIAFTDSDCFATPAWLEHGLAALGGAEIVQGAVAPEEGVERDPFDRTIVVDGDDGWFRTANMFVRRELFQRLGGFQDWIVESGGDPPFGWRAPADGRPAEPARKSIGEDTLFGWRARRGGARVAYAPDALVHHAIFPGAPAAAIRSRWHMRHIPALVAEMPELRDSALHRRWFLSSRSARFDLAALAVVIAVATGRRSALLGVIPYARTIHGEAREWRRRGVPFPAGARVAEDAATAASLALGSAAWRALVL